MNKIQQFCTCMSQWPLMWTFSSSFIQIGAWSFHRTRWLRDGFSLVRPLPQAELEWCWNIQQLYKKSESIWLTQQNVNLPVSLCHKRSGKNVLYVIMNSQVPFKCLLPLYLSSVSWNKLLRHNSNHFSSSLCCSHQHFIFSSNLNTSAVRSDWCGCSWIHMWRFICELIKHCILTWISLHLVLKQLVWRPAADGLHLKEKRATQCWGKKMLQSCFVSLFLL